MRDLPGLMTNEIGTQSRAGPRAGAGFHGRKGRHSRQREILSEACGAAPAGPRARLLWLRAGNSGKPGWSRAHGRRGQAARVFTSEGWRGPGKPQGPILFPPQDHTGKPVSRGHLFPKASSSTQEGHMAFQSTCSQRKQNLSRAFSAPSPRSEAEGWGTCLPSSAFTAAAWPRPLGGGGGH